MSTNTLEKPKTEKQQMKKRDIRKVAVLGSGVMGSRIACHFAHIGLEVVLLDIVPFEFTDAHKKKGLTESSPAFRNSIVNAALEAALKSKPSPIYDINSAKRIQTGNFTDNMAWIADCDWVLEAVVERLDIKHQVYEQVEKHRRPGSLITSNTSGIPMQFLIKGRSEDFRKNFCGTHFFNPPRYLRLFEVIPAPDTEQEVVDFLMHYGDLYLGKTTVLCKDTPAFIANRVGVFSLMSAIHATAKLGLSVSETDKLTGPVIGHAKSATFRTSDVVGLDTTVKVANGLYAGLVHDESRETFKLPEIVAKLEENKWLGDKTGQGFYKKTKDENGRTAILELNLKTLEYGPAKKASFASLESTKDVDDLKKRLRILTNAKDKAGEFYRITSYELFRYVSLRIPEIADELYRIDQAVAAGFAWDLGPYEKWDALGVRETTDKMKAAGYEVAGWVTEMLAAGFESFYKAENGKRMYYDIPSKAYKVIPGTENFIILDSLRQTHKVWGNAGSTIFDLGDGILGLEFHTKMNALGPEVIQGINTAIDMAEKDYRGLVIGNEAPHFSAGANLAMLFMYACDGEFDEINLMIAQFQKTMMRMRYSSVPVVSAPSGMALGGGCELSLHCDRIQAHTETYMGLVEVGVGLIPAGGGTKEMVMRAAAGFGPGDPELNKLQDVFTNIAMAKVSTSAHEAVGMGYIRAQDGFSVNRSRLIADAKRVAIELAEAGYSRPLQNKEIKVLGKSALSLFHAAITSFRMGKYISEHDAKIASKLAFVMAGGDLSYSTMVSEQYLLDLEREAFLSLTGEKKTLERIQSILFKGKPLRN